MPDANWGSALVAESKRRLFDESVRRIRKCLDQLTDDEIWYRPNTETVSIGNLVLHLLTPWGICKAAYLPPEPKSNSLNRSVERRLQTVS